LIIKSTLKIVNNEIKYKAKLELQLGNIPLVECHPSQINQVFMNLAVNAAQAIENKGIITISTCRIDDWICTSISDNGSGMSTETKEHILEPFFTTKPIGEGTGLGLSVSYGIIKDHHGRIEIDSVLGKRTTFHVWLPIAQPEDDQENNTNVESQAPT